ncbi:hypothetical protein [Paracoccus sp. MKU1]|uniref:hypothetical protein n=1 Tax=Paracoccus sp. MKU1 TaxID=1745182 RepID=UPI0007190A28|nr:hypothetical protein [Paracoccus sp. MKU1]KRW96836.1 hypothetical protein AQY21_07040 [Paracoccus sp. MKU1]
MTQALSVLAVLLVAVTMGLALAHALEFPGKLRLDEQTYRAVQAIYYPGFTIGGLIGELGALLLLPVLLFLQPIGGDRFWWTAAALACLAAGHAVYWLVTHPVNAVWLQDTDISGPGAAFFSIYAGREADWQHLRNLWEYSHIARAVLGMVALTAMVIAQTA